MQKTEQRKLVGIIESEILKLTGDAQAPANLNASLLKDSLARLVAILALGPEPETRPCPYCGRLGMKAATVCGYCWKLTPQA